MRPECPRTRTVALLSLLRHGELRHVSVHCSGSLYWFIVLMLCIGSLIQNLILLQIDFARWPWALRVSWGLMNILLLYQSNWIRRKQSKVFTVARGGAWSCTDCTVRLRRWGTCGAGRPAACGTTSTRTLRSPRKIAGHTANS